MTIFDRRTFISAGVAAGVTVAFQKAKPKRRITGSAIQAIGIGIVGCGVRGLSVLSSFHRPAANIEVRAICDPNEKALDRAARVCAKVGVRNVAKESDLRRLLERKEIDAVAICCPNHWHALAAIWALEAGKHVYLEKPGFHTMWEGVQLLAATRKHQLIVQHGVQLRSSPVLQEAVQKMQEGVIGDVYMARLVVFRPRKNMGQLNYQASSPADLDWDLWQGPAARQRFAEKIVKNGNWHFFWKYGGGELANQGIHEADMALWGLGLTGLPNHVSATGGKFVWDDAKETPEVLNANCRFKQPNTLIDVSVRNWCSNFEDDVHTGNVFYGTKGVLLVSGYVRYRVVLGYGKSRKFGRWVETLGVNDVMRAHVDNFLQCIRNQDPQSLNAPIETSFPACGLVHLSNLAFRSGQSIAHGSQDEANLAPRESLFRPNYPAGFSVPELHSVG